MLGLQGILLAGRIVTHEYIGNKGARCVSDPPRYGRFGRVIGPGSLADRLRRTRLERGRLFRDPDPLPEAPPPLPVTPLEPVKPPDEDS